MNSKLHYFWKRVSKTDSCWLWTGAKCGRGYGHLRRNKLDKMAHRESWEIHNGSIPSGMWVLHTCDNPPCVNPTHLFLGSREENISDMYRKGREFRKINLDETENLRAWYSTGDVSQETLAVQFEISQTHVSRIING